MSSLWVGLGIAALSAGASVYGANKQSKAVKAAAATNAASQDSQNQSAWASYLLSRGVNPQGAATGTLPENPQGINAKLPLWANAAFTSGPKGWRKKGTGGAPVGTLGPVTYAQPGPTADELAAADAGDGAASGSGKRTFGTNLINSTINAAVPGLGTVLSGKPVTIKNVVKDAFDPFGWF